MRKCLKIRVLGNVQTAAYRMHVQKSAADLGIEGTLQNAPDGNVIVYACAPADVLDVFIDALYANTKETHVQDVLAEPFMNEKDLRGVFRIIGD